MRPRPGLIRLLIALANMLQQWLYSSGCHAQCVYTLVGQQW